MPATLDRPVTGDYDLIAALLADPTLSADEAARFVGVPLPALAVDDEPGDATLSPPWPADCGGFGR